MVGGQVTFGSGRWGQCSGMHWRICPPASGISKAFSAILDEEHTGMATSYLRVSFAVGESERRWEANAD